MKSFDLFNLLVLIGLTFCQTDFAQSVTLSGEKLSLDKGWLFHLGDIPFVRAKNDGWDAMPVTVQVLDAKGRPVPTANNDITFEISDGAAIIGVGNGNSNSHEPDKGNMCSLFNGLAQVIIQSKEGSTVPVSLIARSPGLKDARVEINLTQAAIIPFIK